MVWKRLRIARTTEALRAVTTYFLGEPVIPRDGPDVNRLFLGDGATPGGRALAFRNDLSAANAIFAEAVDDRVAALLQPGVGIGLTYNDGTNRLTIDNTADGALGRISSVTFISSSVVDISLPAGYVAFKLFVRFGVSSVGASAIYARLSMDGTNFLSGASDYTNAVGDHYSDGTNAAGGSNAASAIQVSQVTVGSHSFMELDLRPAVALSGERSIIMARSFGPGPPGPVPPLIASNVAGGSCAAAAAIGVRPLKLRLLVTGPGGTSMNGNWTLYGWS